MDLLESSIEFTWIPLLWFEIKVVSSYLSTIDWADVQGSLDLSSSFTVFIRAEGRVPKISFTELTYCPFVSIFAKRSARLFYFYFSILSLSRSEILICKLTTAERKHWDGNVREEKWMAGGGPGPSQIFQFICPGHSMSAWTWAKLIWTFYNLTSRRHNWMDTE